MESIFLMDPISSAFPTKGINKEETIIKKGIGREAETLFKENSLDSSKTTTGKD